MRVTNKMAEAWRNEYPAHDDCRNSLCKSCLIHKLLADRDDLLAACDPIAKVVKRFEPELPDLGWQQGCGLVELRRIAQIVEDSKS